MIKNNKGFMLAEVVIVSAILITTLVSLYVGFARVYKAYEERSSFFDTDSIYALKSIEDTLIDDMVFNELVKRIDSDNYIYFSNGSITIDNDYIKEYIKKIMENYNIEYFYLTKYDSNSLNTIINLDNDNIVFNDFLSYLNKNLDFTEEYNYIFASKTIDGRFAYLRVL